ncbi:MAG: tetratricopeptide repeat protein [Lachnospiraceae bacterium]|nr:tetratricopeptide repeat protein [Lachnospiraceae bacterium]
MKKLIAMFVILILLAAGFLGYQGYERSQQTGLFADASVYFEEQDYQKAIQLFEEAKEHHSLFSGSLEEEFSYYQAEAYMNLEEYDKAIAIYDEYIKENEKESMNYVLKGYCYMQAKEYDQAVDVYKTAYEKTKDGEFLLNLCNVYITTEEYDQALSLISKHQDLEDEDTVRQLLFSEIAIYEKQQDYSTAYEKAKAYVESYPDDADGIKEMEFLESRQ